MSPFLPRLPSQRGAAAVEFALILPLVLLMVFGLVDFSLAYQRNVTLAHAAREGVRTWALSNPAAPSNPTSSTTGAATGIPAPIPVSCATAPAAGTPWTTVSCGSPCTAGAPARVTATHTYAFVTPVGSFMGMFGGDSPDSVVLRGQGVMRCGG